MCQSVDRFLDILSTVGPLVAATAVSGLVTLFSAATIARRGHPRALAAARYEQAAPRFSGPRTIATAIVCALSSALGPSIVSFAFGASHTSGMAWTAGASAVVALASLPILWVIASRRPAQPRTQSGILLCAATIAAGAAVWPLGRATVTEFVIVLAAQTAPIFGMAAVISRSTRAKQNWTSFLLQLKALPLAGFTGIVMGAVAGILTARFMSSGMGTKLVNLADWPATGCGDMRSSLACAVGLLVGFVGRRSARTWIGPFLNDVSLVTAGILFGVAFATAALCEGCGAWSALTASRPLLSCFAAFFTGVAGAWAIVRTLATGFWGWFAAKPSNSADDGLTNHPIEHPHQDLLGRWRLARYLVTSIRGTRSRGGVILLAGGFGSGKTSVLNLARFILSPDQTHRFLTISAQTLDDGNRLLLAALERVAEDLGEFTGRWSTWRLFRRYAHVLSLIPQGNAATEYLRGLTALGDVYQVRRRLAASMCRAGLTYSLAIEDLDRLPLNTVRTVVRGLQPLFDWDGVVVVVAGDVNVLSDAVEESQT
jgi:hypothetical protein